MFNIQKPYFYYFVITVSAFVLASCNQAESTKDQCQRFTQVMQTVVDETQAFKQNSKFDRDALSQFINITEKSGREITSQTAFNDKSLITFQEKFSSLYDNYTSAGSDILKLNKIVSNPQIGYNSLKKIRQSVLEEKELLTSFNKYCEPQGFKINNVAP
ncbi:hypothetical protein G7B40_000300 [Aetokthonos hydrillicola Thurmond2011]|uniref:Lipoprotein n=1 Tax=Aetokthonos hydrillicola Thurmond2011 TaxID=2712845 RepID=A0AAP5I1J4_9CYAN|nr:hypothetical protein [Aetokthonos hydrillicola]MBO3460169.1 hypothetical protein [Aetokthonos hydrillicola CCALA 1050]MBW4590565.1 hypothetical protein [Aetokthonos hydrillicola CCALA 1050]MDR9893026.1 hypothetical protein [Aetokthonos hydrillicola Thurmond2011]